MKTKNLILAALTSLYLVPFQAIAEIENYLIDLSHASIEFKASHLGYSYVVGRFNQFDGKFSYDEGNPSASAFDVTIDIASLDSNHAERDKKLKGSDFLDAKAHPQGSFILTDFSENPDGTFTANGDFTLRGITQSITVEGQHIGHGKDPWGGYRRGFEGTAMLDATDYELPDWVGDVEIYLVVEGIRQ